MAMLPDNPNTRLERYLARLAGQDVTIPETPITRIECYLAYLIENGGGAAAPNAGAHNAVFRGKNLGASFTSAQSAAITAGTFDDLFIGDYWTDGDGVKYRIAGFDLFTQLALSETRTHYAVVIPDSSLYSEVMYQESMTGGYLPSYMKTDGLTEALGKFKALFGESHIVKMRDWFTSTVNQSAATASEWADSYIDLPTMSQVLGVTLTNFYNWGTSYCRFPLFDHQPSLVATTGGYWFRDVWSGTSFLTMASANPITSGAATSARGVRPYVAIA